MALPKASVECPQPSRTARTKGRDRAHGVVAARCRRDDGREHVRLEAGPADQAAVDAGSREQLGRVVGGDAAAVEHARRRAGARRDRLAGCAGTPPPPGRAWRCDRCRSPTPARRRSPSRPGARRVGRRGQHGARAGGRRRRRWSPASRSASVSPTARMTRRPWRRAAANLRAVSSSVSPSRWRRSEWPTRTRSHQPASIAGETSPVNAPASSQNTSCAPSRTALAESTSRTAQRCTNGGRTATSTARSLRAPLDHGPRQGDTLGRRWCSSSSCRRPSAGRDRGAQGATAGRSSSAATPGRLRPSRNSRVAPPPVLMKSICPQPRRPRPRRRGRPRRRR